MKIKYVEYTSVGKVRTVNQDRIFSRSDGDYSIFVVADGMGGHYHGEIASSLLIDEIEKGWNEIISTVPDLNAAKDIIKQIIMRVNGSLYADYSKKGIICGTTVAVLLIYSDQYAILNSGDSRIYMMSGFKIMQETMDHTAGKLLDEVNEKKSAKLLSAVGCKEECLIYVKTNRIEKNAYFLVCSDGLYRYNSIKCIKRVLLLYSKPEAILNKLVINSEKGGASDNLSGILVKCSLR